MSHPETNWAETVGQASALSPTVLLYEASAAH